MTRVILFAITILILLPSCSEGAVVFAPTPLPPEIAPTTYTHSTGAFSLLLPRNWASYEQETSSFARVSLSPPNSTSPAVEVMVLNMGQEIQVDLFGTMLSLYQTQFRPDVARYTEESRESLGDGSWRITGLRRTASGQTQQVNTFLQRNGTLLGIIEVTLPRDPARQAQTQTIINTLTLYPPSSLPVTDLSVLSGAARVGLEVVNISTWTAHDGVFFVTGEVANHSDQFIAELPIRAILQSAEGSMLADALDQVMGYAIEPDGFAPFSIRFGQGQPVNALNYTVILGGASYQTPPEEAIITAPDLTWTDETQYSPDGALFITGTIKNQGSVDMQSPRVITTIFDDQGRVIAAGFVDSDAEVLPKNSETTYTLLIPVLGGTAANYIVNVQGLSCAHHDC